MQIINNTPFPAIGWSSVDSHDNEYVSIVSRVKLLFDFMDEEGFWSLKLAPEQEALFDTDVFYDEACKEIRYESDFVPYKQQADLIVKLSKKKREYGKRGVEVLRYKETIEAKSLLRHMSLNHLGFVHRAEDSRLQWTGTTDEQWVQTRAPKLPKDFNEKHYNAAHPDLQLKNQYFEAGDMIVFHKLLPGEHKQFFMLPGIYIKATCHSEVGKNAVLLEADTVVLDIENLDMKENALYISYRHRMSMVKKITQLSIDMKLEKAFIEERSA